MDKSEGTVRIWYDAWQMQCCGDPFGVGDPVALTVDPERDLDWLVPALGPELVRSIDVAEAHHEDLSSVQTINGTVTAIFIARPLGEHAAPRQRRASAGTGSLEAVERMKRFEADARNYSGYVIDLRPDEPSA